jgi:hypothetical protein
MRLAALAGVLVVGAAAAATTGLATSALADTGTPSGVQAVDVAAADATELDGLAYAFPAGSAPAPAAAPTTTVAAATPATGSRAAAPVNTGVVNAPAARAVPMAMLPVPGCTASNNSCGLPTCDASNAGCSLLNCVAIAACTPGVNGLGSCAGTVAGGVLGCGLGSAGINDCFFGLGCGLGGFGLGGCGLLSLSGCGIDPLGFDFGRHNSGCGGLFGGCGFNSGCGGGDDDNHRGNCNNFGFSNFNFRDFRHFNFSSSHGHDSRKH